MDFFEIVWILIIGGAFFLKLLNIFIRNEEHNEIFSTAAGHYKGNYSKGSFLNQPKFNCSINGMNLQAEKVNENKENFLNLSIEYSPSFKGNFLLEEETTISRLKNTVGLKDIQTGDTAFDATICISASHPSLVYAVFNSETRSQVIKIIRGSESFSIKNRSTVISYPFEDISSSQTLCKKIDLLVSTVEMITETGNLKKRLIQNIQTETLPVVIINNIKALTTKYPKDKESKQILKTTLGDRNISVQIEAARHLGKSGMKHLTTLLEEKEPMIAELRNKVVTLLGDNKYIPSRPILQEVYRNRAGLELQKTILKTFEKFENAKLEPFLIEQLANKETDLRHASIEALGTCGTIKAAEKIYILAKDSLNPFTKNTAQKAISKIQSRLGDVEKGWLSISDSPEKEGALSISKNSTEGALSLEAESKKKIKDNS